MSEQIEYYRRRAAEYDEWFLRQGRYDRGAEANRQWFEEVERVRTALAGCASSGRVLELACGTGLWTERLAAGAAQLTVVDASPEMLELCRRRVGPAAARFVHADLDAWTPDGEYDFVFFGFYLSHVPPERFERFWSLVDACLARSGRVFFVDSLYDPESTASDHRLGGPRSTSVIRRLNDGEEFEIVKVFHRPDELEARLALIGWEIEVQGTSRFFLYGHGGRAERPGETSQT